MKLLFCRMQERGAQNNNYYYTIFINNFTRFILYFYIGIYQN